MHWQLPKEGPFYPNPTATQKPGSAPLTTHPYLLVVGLSEASWTKLPSCHAAQDFWPPSVFPVWLPLGTDISKLRISSSWAIKCWPWPWLWPRQGAQWEKGQAPGRCSRGGRAGRHEGMKARRPASRLGAESPRERQQVGALDSLLPGQIPSSHSSRAPEGGLITMSHPSEGGK